MPATQPRPTSLAAALARVSAALRTADIGDGPDEARRLVALALGLAPLDLITDGGRMLGAVEAGRVEAWLRRRLDHEPLSRIAGVREFYGRRFTLGPETLDPRPDSETLIAAVLEIVSHRCRLDRPPRILDIGTGTGCLILTLLAELPLASGVGTDFAPGALSVARENARGLGLAERVQFELRDVFAPLEGREGERTRPLDPVGEGSVGAEPRSAPAPGVAVHPVTRSANRGAGPSSRDDFGPFDILISNPPYIPSASIPGLGREVRDFDPRAALDGGRDGLDFYARIFASLVQLVPDGFAVLEVGAGQAGDVAALARVAGFSGEPRMWRDLGGHTRVVAFPTGLSSAQY